MDALYQKQILELAKQSRTRELDISAPLQASCDNPTCGDRVDISFALKDGAISNIGIKVRGCALCEAGAGLVVAQFEGMKQETARQMTAQFATWIGKEQDQAPNEERQNLCRCVISATGTNAFFWHFRLPCMRSTNHSDRLALTFRLNEGLFRPH